MILRPPNALDDSSKHFNACLKASTRSDESTVPGRTGLGGYSDARSNDNTPRARNNGGNAGFNLDASLSVDVANCR